MWQDEVSRCDYMMPNASAETKAEWHKTNPMSIVLHRLMQIYIDANMESIRAGNNNLQALNDARRAIVLAQYEMQEDPQFWDELEWMETDGFK